MTPLAVVELQLTDAWPVAPATVAAPAPPGLPEMGPEVDEYIHRLEAEGRRILALIDTGSNVSAIDPWVARALGVQPVKEQETRVPAFGRAGMRVPCYEVGLRLGHGGASPAFGLSAPALPLREELAVDAIVGLDVLRRFHFVYDGPGQSARLSFDPDSPGEEMDGGGKDAHVLTFQTQDGWPHVDASVFLAGQDDGTGYPARAVIDTGARVCAVDRGLLLALGARPTGGRGFNPAGRARSAPIYEVDIAIHGTAGERLTLVKLPAVAQEVSMAGAHITLGVRGLYALRFVLDGPTGRFSLSLNGGA